MRQNTPHPKELKAKAHKLFAAASSGAAAPAAPPQQQPQPQPDSQDQEETVGQSETPDQSLNMQEGDVESLPTDPSIDKVLKKDSLI